MEKFKLFVNHDYSMFPTVIEIEAEDQIQAMEQFVEKWKSTNIIGKVSAIQFFKG